MVAPPPSGRPKEDAAAVEAGLRAARSFRGDGRLVIAAHSLGGAEVVERLKKDRKAKLKAPTAVALLDSTHRGAVPGHATHWLASPRPLDDPKPRPWINPSDPIRSGGTTAGVEITRRRSRGAAATWLLL